MEHNDMDQVIVGLTLLATLTMFIWGRWRYDVIALAALLFLVLVDIVPSANAFSGFGHRAVITVGAVLIVSRGLENSGLIDLIAQWLGKASRRPETLVASNTALVAASSAFMNNVGALALMLPAGIQIARKAGHSPAILLMPLGFASLLGGLMTLVGTPPNVIIASARARDGMEPFAMFDFFPVGVILAVVGVIYLSLIGWRLVPRREETTGADDLFDVEGYLTEVQAVLDAPAVGQTVRELENSVEESITILGIFRGTLHVPAPAPMERIQLDDVLVVKADADAIEALVTTAGVQPIAGTENIAEALSGNNVELLEAVVAPGTLLAGRSVRSIRLRERFGVNLVAIARSGGRIHQRLRDVRFQPGDVILLQGETETLQRAMPELGCLPLASRGLRFRAQPRVALAVALFGGALVAAAGLQLVPIEIALLTAVLAMGLVGLITVRDSYEAVNWPVLVLLGAMIPVGEALETTGAAERIANAFVAVGGDWPTALVVLVLLLVAATLSDIVNNAAAALLLAPIAFRVADGLAISSDPMLMAVAVGASASFLTPIGHQSNLLVMGPGGCRFSDYWRVGLPLQTIVIAVATPAILYFWPA
ncbi:MAG: SLC13 family permease [Chloroflexi bacterium]|nr:SLC13 family permease [Chloroflexota bacterium]